MTISGRLGSSLMQFHPSDDIDEWSMCCINASDGSDAVSLASSSDSEICRQTHASTSERVEHLGSVLGHPGGVHLLPQEYEGIGDADADQRGAKADAQQLGAVPDDGTGALQGREGLVARGHALECVLGAVGEEARQACLDSSSPRPEKGNPQKSLHGL